MDCEKTEDAVVICDSRSAWRKAPCAAGAVRIVRASLGTAAPLRRCLQQADPGPSAGIINSASAMFFVSPASWESTHPLAKGFGLASAHTTQGQPLLERPDSSPQRLDSLSSGPPHRLLIKHQGD